MCCAENGRRGGGRDSENIIGIEEGERRERGGRGVHSTNPRRGG